jgi:hypothetical protein
MRARWKTCLVSAATALTVAHGLAQRPAFPQPASPLSADDSSPGVAEQIEEIQSSQGINSPGLIAPLTNLGLILREQGDPALAAAAFERARHIVRVTHGLSSFEEAPLLRQLIQIEEGKGDAAAAWDLEQKLLALIRRYPGPRAAPMLREIADKRADVLTRYSAGEFPPQIVLGCYYGGQERDGGNCRVGSSDRVKAALLNEVRSYYSSTIEMIVGSEGWFAPELPELHLALVRAGYAAFPDDSLTTAQGAEILRFLRTLSVHKKEPLPVQVSARVRIADWDLLFAGGRKENEAAFKAYETLYDYLEEQGLDRPTIDDIFAPSVPVVLPAFLPNPLVSMETPGASGYIDVAFDITKYGEGKAIEILDTTTNHTEAARLRLFDLIRRSRFRPRMADGAFEDPSRVVARYYVNE